MMSPRVVKLIDKKNYSFIKKYVVENRFSHYAVYYRKENDRAAFVLPDVFIARDRELYDVKMSRLGEGAMKIVKGRLAVTIYLDGDLIEDIDGENIDALLGRGEENIFVNDFEGSVASGDFWSLEEEFRLEEGLIYRFLSDNDYIYPSGNIVTRFINDVRQNGLERIDWTAEGITSERTIEILEQKIIHKINDVARKNNPVTRKYSMPAGLFSYDGESVNFEPHLGRGEHIVFFNVLAGKEFGAYTPYSFVDILLDVEKSKNVFRKLMAQSILDRKGNLVKGRSVEGVIFDGIPDEEQQKIKAMVESARPLTFDDLMEDLRENMEIITEDIAALKTSIRNNTEADYLVKYITSFNEEEREKLVKNYQEAIIDRRVADESVKYRGILLKSEDDEILILLTEPPDTVPGAFSFLYDYFQNSLPDMKDFKIAYAYQHPTPRNRGRVLHPIVKAVRSFFTEKLCENNIIEGCD